MIYVIAFIPSCFCMFQLGLYIPCHLVKGYMYTGILVIFDKHK